MQEFNSKQRLCMEDGGEGEGGTHTALVYAIIKKGASGWVTASCLWSAVQIICIISAN